MVGEFELSLEAAQQRIASGRADLSRYAIAWDGYVTDAGMKTDAILVEAAERGSSAVLLAQCYGPLEPDAEGKLVRACLGEPVMLGRVPSRLDEG